MGFISNVKKKQQKINPFNVARLCFSRAVCGLVAVVPVLTAVPLGRCLVRNGPGIRGDPPRTDW